jgi:hypothetical protein
LQHAPVEIHHIDFTRMTNQLCSWPCCRQSCAN